MFHTSDEEIESIALKEGFRAKAHNTWGNWEIGYGQENALFPGTAGEITVTEGLEIDEHTAKQALYFFVYNVVDPRVRSHFNPQTQDEHDACASFVYNIKLGKLDREEYTLPKLVCRADRSPDALQEIIDKWFEYCLTPGAETGLFRRRLIEVMKFLSLPWDAPSIMGLVRSVRVANLTRGEEMENAAYIHPTGKFAASIDPDYILDMAESYDDLHENGKTAALNNAEARDLGADVEDYIPPDTPKVKPKAAEVKKVEKPTIDPNQEPVLIEKSKTGKAVNRASRGKETTIIGTITGGGLTAAAANAEKVGSVIEKFRPETFVIMAAMLGLLMVAVGGIMWWSGRSEAHWRRQIEQDPKV